jgi:glycosyltransferase involved in cell wall biosynthesis
MTKKIAFFLPALDGGGAERVFVTLANSLANHGYQVDFVLSNAQGNYLSALDSKIKIIDLGRQHVVASFVGLGRYLRAHKPEIILSGLSNANAAVLVATRIFLPSCKTIITQHVNWSQVLTHHPTLKERAVYQLSKILYPLATQIVAVSNGIANEIKKMRNVYPGKIQCIYNPVVTPELLELSEQPPSHPWLLNKDEPVLIGVGRLVEQKDFETLIRAYYRVQKQITCKLLILGEGPERQKLENLVQELDLTSKIDLPGFASNPYTNMTHSDLFVLSSQFEGLPTVLIEAMACGCPLVSTDCDSGPDEILDNGRYGALVPVGDVSAMTQAIIQSLQNPPEKELLRKRAQLYSVENATRAYTHLIELLAMV